MAEGEVIDMAQMRRRETSDKIEWDDLVRRELRASYGRTARQRKTRWSKEYKRQFLVSVFKDARNISDREPEEISKTMVDVNEKEYSNYCGNERGDSNPNHHGSDRESDRKSESDETTVKISKCVENAEGHSYTATTTKGVEWGGGVDIGLQFGMPQIGINASAGGNFNYKRNYIQMLTEAITKTNTVESESHHEETVKIPPGMKVVVKMTSYRVRYKLPYTMEYKVPKIEGVPVKYYACGLGLVIAHVPILGPILGLCCNSTGYLTAVQLLHTLPGYREDDDYVYFTQEGELRWIADRMEVDKKISPL